MYGQAVEIVGIDTTALPQIKVRVKIIDAAGKPVAATADNISVFEAGRPVTQALQIEPGTGTATHHPVMIAIEDASSMKFGSKDGSNIDLAKAFSKMWTNVYGVEDAGCGLMSVNGMIAFHRDYTRSGIEMRAAIDRLEPAGYSRYRTPSRNILVEAIDATRSNDKSVVIAVISGGVYKPADVKFMVDMAKSKKTIVNVVMLGGSCPTEYRDLCKATGGLSIDNVTTLDQVTRACYRISNAMQDMPGSQISWMTQSMCVSDGFIDVRVKALQAEASYSIYMPNRLTGSVMNASPPTMFMRSGSKSSYDTTIVLRSRVMLTIDTVVSSHPKFTATPSRFTLQPGDSIAVKLSYTPQGSVYDYCTYQFLGSSCGFDYHVIADGTSSDPESLPLRITNPNPQNEIMFGRTDTISWGVISDREPVHVSIKYDKDTWWTSLGSWTAGRAILSNYDALPSIPYTIRIVRTDSASKPQPLFSMKPRKLTATIQANSDGELIAVSNMDSTLTVNDAVTGEVVATFQQVDAYSQMSWSPDSKYFAARGRLSNIVRIFDVHAQAMKAKVPIMVPVILVHWSATTGKLYCVDTDLMIHVVDPATGAVQSSYKFDAGTYLYYVADRAGTRIAMMSYEGVETTFTVVDLRNGTIIGQFKDTTAVQVAMHFSDKDTSLLHTSTTYGGDGVKTYNYRTGKRINALPQSPNGSLTRFSYGDKYYMTLPYNTSNQISDQYGIKVYDMSTGRTIAAIPMRDTVISNMWLNAEKDIAYVQDARGKIDAYPAPWMSVKEVRYTGRSIDATNVLQVHHVELAPVPNQYSGDTVIAIATNVSNHVLPIDGVLATSSTGLLSAATLTQESMRLSPNEKLYVRLNYRATVSDTLYATLGILRGKRTDTCMVRMAPVANQYSIASLSYNFGEVRIGGIRDSTQEEWLRNFTESPLQIESVRFIGPNLSDFSLREFDTNATIEPLTGMKATMTYTPSFPGRTTSILDIRLKGVDVPVLMALNGEGVTSTGVEEDAFTTAGISAYPNPAYGSTFTIRIADMQHRATPVPTQVLLKAQLGRVVAVAHMTATADSWSATLNIGSLPGGLYYAIAGSNSLQAIPVVVVH